MLSRVLVAMDDSETSEKALRYALDAHPDVEITVLVVVGEPSGMFGAAAAVAVAEDPEQLAREHAEPVLELARSVAAEHGVEVATDVRSGHPAGEIIEYADGFDTVVIGSHSSGLASRLFVGNVTEKVVRQSPVPVTVVR
jgi:nucleotide-binding universal stress UspA family protein